jgi:gliding motility-associated lipoprotein GldD
MIRFISIIFLVSLVLNACNSDYTIKRRGYFRIAFPEHKYQLFNEPGYPYSFEYPVYSRIVKDTNFFEQKPDNPWSINIEFPGFDGKIYMSYKDVRKNDFDKLVSDAFTMTYKHTTKATEIKDSLMTTGLGLRGVFFQVGGNAATANQFFVTDSVKHFLRGALYFDATPNEDSLRVVNEFLKTDMRHLINTLRWKN